MADDKKTEDSKALETKKQADTAVQESKEEAEARQAQADRIAELEKQLAESQAQVKANNKLESAAKQVANVAKQASGEGTTIQCILRRKGGTTVTFGHNRAKQVTYHFKPIDENDKNSPHICNVTNDEHADRFLSIPESYRLYREGAGYIDKIEVTSGTADDEKSFVNKFDDILSIDFETADNETVKDWAKEVLGFTLSHSAKIRAKADSFDIEEKSGDNMLELLRKIGHAMQAEEIAASEQADKDK